MYEVELKVPADLDRVRARLGDLGAESLGMVTQIDTYYDAPHRDFAETDEALRIRREEYGGEEDGNEEDGSEEDRGDESGGDGTTQITYKGPLVEAESKTREEIEMRVPDSDRMDAILQSAGFDPAATVRKDRERYALDGYTITLDSVEGVGEFVEVETEAPEAAVERAREGAVDVLRKLGLDPNDQIRTSYLGLLLNDASE